MTEHPRIETFQEFETRVGGDYREPVAFRYAPLFLDSLDAPGPEHEFLIDGWLTAGDKSVIGGPSRSGKSFFAIHAGMCVATGMQFFGSDVEQGLVCYQAGEGVRGVKKRLRAWRKHHNAKFDRSTPFVLLQSPINLHSPDGDTDPLITEIKAISQLYDLPLRMVVIDTLATATGGADENSGKDMGLVMQNVAKINAATNAHVCLVHHMNAGGTKIRGHTSVYAAVDQVVVVNRNEVTGVRTVKLDKQKDDEDGKIIQFELMRIDLGFTPKGKPINSCVCLPLGEKETIRREEEVKGYSLNDNEVIFMKALFEADRLYGQPVPSDMAISSSVRSVVSYDQVKRVYAGMNPSDVTVEEGASEEDKKKAELAHREALKKRLQRIRAFLQSAGIIGAGDMTVTGEGGSSKVGVVWHTGRPLRAFPQTMPRESSMPDAISEGGIGDIPF